MAGDKRVDNKKFKAAFQTKAKMLSAEEVAKKSATKSAASHPSA